MEKVIEKFFTVGKVVKMDYKVAYSMGTMYGKVQLFPTKYNIFFKDEYQYIGVFDSDWQGIMDVTYYFRDFLIFTDIPPIELYKFVVKKFESSVL
jgi:hypothetical protein